MSVDKLVDSAQLDTDLTTVANAIRTKGGTSASLNFPDDFIDAIDAIPTGGGNLQSKTKSYTPSETAQSETVTADVGYDGLDEVDISVGAISSTYVGSGIARKSSSDLTASGATVTAPAGYYENSASKSVASGSAATPATTITATPTISIDSDAKITATVSTTKSVTPTVSAGYVSSGTAGTITVTGSATNQMTKRTSSDLSASGATVTAPAGYYPSAATKSVSSGTEGTPTASKGTVTSNTVLITPSVVNSAGYISGGTHTGTAVSVTAAELVSGSETKTANGTYDVTNLAQLIVNVSGGGGDYPWFGQGAEKVGTVINWTINLKNDTTYDSWTASTTASTIKAASSTPDYSFTANLTDYDYLFVTKGFCQPAYLAGTTLKQTIYRAAYFSFFYIYGYPNATYINDMRNGTSSDGASLNSGLYFHALYYYNSSGVLASRSLAQEGPIYWSAVPSITNANPGQGQGSSTVTYTVPAFQAKCQSARFSTSMKTKVDSANTNFSVVVELYRVPHGKSFPTYVAKEWLDALNAT